MSVERTLERLLSRASDANIRFDDLRALLESLGFEMRVRGSHHLFHKPGIEERINLQRDGIMPSRTRLGRCELLF